MAKKTAQATVSSSDSDQVQYILSAQQVLYLGKLAALKKEHSRASGFAQKQLFVKMIHLFMQEVCGYPEGSYLVTTSAYGDEACGSYPHVVPVAFYANSALFYFTPSDDLADVQDLWVRHGQVYTTEPKKGDAARECATQIICSNFNLIDGAKKNTRNDSWEPWSASDIKGARSPRVRLNDLSEDKELDPVQSNVIRARLASIAYQSAPDTKKTSGEGHARLGELMRKANHDSLAFSAKEKRGEGPLDLPLYAIDQIEESETKRRSAALVQTDAFNFRAGTNGLLSHKISYSQKTDLDRNLLVCGDNLEVMQRMHEDHGSFLDLIYIDPPFCSNRNYDSPLEGQNFEDKWRDGLRTYLPWLLDRVRIMKQLLKPSGSIFIHLDWHAVHYVKIELDKVFGYENFGNEIIWRKLTAAKAQSGFYSNVKDTILFYTKDQSKTVFNRQYAPGDEQKDFKTYPYIEDKTGRRYGSFDFTQAGAGPARRFGKKTLSPPPGKHWIWSQDKVDEGMKSGRVMFNSNGTPRVKRYLDEKKGNQLGDLWYDDEVTPLSSNDSQRSGYPTQKPEALLKRIILSASNPGDVVADFFVGSGTTVSVAQKLGRRWVGVDQNPQAIAVTSDRIRNIAFQKDKAIGIPIEDFGLATKVGFRQLVGTRYHREDVRQLDDTQSGKTLSEFQNFILDCYLPKDGRKGDAQLPGFRVENGREVVVFIGPNRQETKQHHVVEYLNSVSRRAPNAKKIEILGWSFAPSLLKQLDSLVSENGTEIELKKIHVSPVDIEKALAEKNVKFIPAARATMADIERKGNQLACKLKLVTPASEIRDVHWFIYPHPTEDLQRIEYNFAQDDAEAGSENSADDNDSEAEVSTKQANQTVDSKLSYTFKGIKDGEYRIYVRMTDRRGNPTALIENLRIKGTQVERIDDLTEQKVAADKKSRVPEAA